MPTSYYHHVPGMVHWIMQTRPRSILDIGVGYGKWGFLSREYTDIIGERYQRSDWQTTIDGVEGFRGYANPVYDYVYNQVHFGDVRDVLPSLGNYDLAIMGDVIEHFEKADGMNLLQDLRAKTQFVLIASPAFFHSQEVEVNPFETHRSYWNWKDFQGLEFDYEEFAGSVFVALVRGMLPSRVSLRLDGRAARFVYSMRWLRRHSRFAQIVKTQARRLPGCGSFYVRADQ